MIAFVYQIQDLSLTLIGPRMISLEVGPRHGITKHSCLIVSSERFSTKLEFADLQKMKETLALLKRVGFTLSLGDASDLNNAAMAATVAKPIEAKPTEAIVEIEHKCLDCPAQLVKKGARGRWPLRCEKCRDAKALAEAMLKARG